MTTEKAQHAGLGGEVSSAMGADAQTAQVQTGLTPSEKGSGLANVLEEKGSSHISARSLALRLLRLCRCPACDLPVREPVTLPCGHSACLSCIVQQTSNAFASDALPSSSHLPPRLPLAASTVPCPTSGCPRNAIGRGLGSWSGHYAVYGEDVGAGLPPPSSESGEGDTPAQMPLDGFIIPTNQNSTSLSVVPAQRRHSFMSKYAISKYDTHGKKLSEETPLLRNDVTLTKAVEVIRQIAGIPASWPSRSQRAEATVPTGTPSSRLRRGSARTRRRLPGSSCGRAGLSVGVQDSRHMRTEINQRFLGVMGASEAGIDSGAVGGVSAVMLGDSDEEGNEKSAFDDQLDAEGSSDHESHYSTTDFDDDDEEIGGAFARRYDFQEQEKRMRCHALRRQSGQISEDLYDSGLEGNTLDRVIEQASVNDKWTEDALGDRQKALDSLHSEMMDVLECQLCYMLLYQPLTTPCGHTFCRRCFARSLDHSTSCPLCRAEMPKFSFFQEHPCNKMIVDLLKAQVEVNETNSSNAWGLAQFYQERKVAVERDERESLLSTPIFVCTLGFPCMPTILHIFEPRYRLMIRRCLESGHPRFGMVMHSQDMSGGTPGISPYGTMLEIKTVQMLPDGRSMIETVGSYRFRVLDKGSLDGYTVGHIAPIEDVFLQAEFELEQASLGNFDLWTSDSPTSSGNNTRTGASSVSPISADDDRSSFNSSGSLSSATHLTLAEAQTAHAVFQAALGLDSLARDNRSTTAATVSPAFVQRTEAELIEACNSFIETLRSGSAPWLMTRLNDTYGPKPDASDVAAFGYWMALVMPIDEHEKAKLLPIRSARLRLCIVVHWIEQLRQTWWFNHGCSIQ